MGIETSWQNTAFWPCMGQARAFGEPPERKPIGTGNVEIRFGSPACEIRISFACAGSTTTDVISVSGPLIKQYVQVTHLYASMTIYLSVPHYSQVVDRSGGIERILISLGITCWVQCRLKFGHIVATTQYVILDKDWQFLVVRHVGPQPAPVTCLSDIESARFPAERIGDAELIILAAEENQRSIVTVPVER